MYDFKTEEEKVLKFWEEKKIYDKIRKENTKGKKFYMMDGPPYATGSIHMGTALNKILKDIAMRSHRLQGCNVFDRAGYDTHGVPIEFQIEKEIGSKSKKDIEKFGVRKFINKCKDFATKYIGIMNSEFKNLGVWMDFDNPYLTLSDGYIEAIWDTFKVADKKKLLYLGKYPIHVCPRCETAVAYNEIEYSKQEDNSIYVKFPLKDKKNTFLIIWTTTPWTLPGNTGVMVHPDYDYQEVELSDGDRWIMAKELIPKIMASLEMGYTIKKEFKGKEMEGWKYENPLSKNLKLKLKNAYKVVLSARYVNLEDGTGLVHCAPGHGKEDYEVGKEYGLDMPSPVDMNGLMTTEAGKYASKKARVVNDEIVKDLKEEGFLVYKLKYTHDYPLCWRCKSPLLMISQPQWFLKISDIHKKLLKENEETNWIPSWMKLRMKAWLEGISDWPVSRKRYWGTPLPIWLCKKCNKRIVIGSVEELKKLAKIPKTKKIGLHKPEIDEVEIDCECGGKMKRVEEVLDVWFDAGVSSWAALGYPRKEDLFKKFWPANLNIEGPDQIRGWWNSQLILSEIKFGKKPFENISVHGLITDIEKRKMSKSLGNIVSPKDIIEKYGRDYLRYYFAKVSKGEDFAFDEEEFLDVQNIFRVLTNVNIFINQLEKGKSRLNIEDKWILSRFSSVVKDVTNCYDNFKLPEVVQALEKFLVTDFSRTYIQMIRERSDEVYEVMSKIREGVLKLFAPITPLITEFLWQELRQNKIVKEESIHLSEFPIVNEKEIDNKLEKEFENILEIIRVAMAERDKAGIGLKWPLAKLTVFSTEKIGKDYIEIISRQLNVKKVEVKETKEKEIKVELDTKMTPELESEGFVREIARKVQAMRKNAGLVKTDKINLAIVTEKRFIERIKSYEDFLKNRTNALKLEFSEKIGGLNGKYSTENEEKVRERSFILMFSRVATAK
jgi:isoleucyl-tRNA synthetase